jgi:hypothetical protein
MIPDNIVPDHIVKAIKEIDTHGIPKNQRSRKYNLVFKGNSYPPKYVVSLANKYANGCILSQLAFKGGKETNTFLIRLGFEVISKLTPGNNSTRPYVNNEWFALLTYLTNAVIYRHRDEAGFSDYRQFDRLQRSVINTIDELKQWKTFQDKYPWVADIPSSSARSRNGVWAEYSTDDLQKTIKFLESRELSDSVLENLKVTEKLLEAFSKIQFILEDAFSYIWTGSNRWDSSSLDENEQHIYSQLFCGYKPR